MDLRLHEYKHYFLTCNNEVRRQHFLQEFAHLDVTAVHANPAIPKHQSGAAGFSRVLDLAAQNQDATKPFQPFGIFEDDVTQYREFPASLIVPDDVDLLYVGLSSCGMNENYFCGTVHFENVSADVIRVYNMLALHGVMVCSLRGALALQRAFSESFHTGTIWDVYTAQLQPHYHVYALRVPLVYQSGVLGGQEEATKVQFATHDNPHIPAHWINTTNASVLPAIPPNVQI